MFYQLPPAGNPISLKKSNGAIQELGDILQSSEFRLYGSGTSALAAAIKAIMTAKGVDSAEVLLPAYTCPELVSAILFAGAAPVLVDFESRRPWLDLTELESKITDKTVAIIAVNLFGISERFDSIRAIIKDREIALIEDSAQYFPASSPDIHWQGDVAILSFGRGKPVSILGGGAVICSDSKLYQYLPIVESIAANGFVADIIFRLKSTAYNILLSPRCYWLPESLPFLHLGETVYHPMVSINPFPAERLAYLPANIKSYWSRQQKSSFNREELFPQFKTSDLIDLPSLCCGTELPPLIRYPFLATTKEQADKLHFVSKHYGLGVSRMYQKPLNEMEGLDSVFKEQGPFPNAKEFADLLLTLPTHPGVPANYPESLGGKLFGVVSL